MRHLSRRTTLTALLMTGAALALPASAGTALDDQIDAYLKASILTGATPADITARCDAALTLGKAAKAGLEGRSGTASMAVDFAAYDSMNLILADAGNELFLISQTSPSKDVRDAAEACIPKLSDLQTAISLSRPIYDRLAAIPQTGLDVKSLYVLQKQLTNYKLAGVDKDEATRARVTALQRQITETGLKFDGNIRDDSGDVAFAPEELKGLPQDWLDGHKPGADGLVHLTYNYPDIIPVIEFADIRETRRKAMTAFNNRGWPANDDVLKALLKERYDLAQVLGFKDYATLITADKMIGSPERAKTFLKDVNAAAEAGAMADYNELVAFAKTVDPGIDVLRVFDRNYLENKLRKQKYDVDSQEVRQYFTLDKSRDGIFQLVHDLFGADIRRWDTPVWADGVTAWQIFDGKTLVGSFYLDLSPRDGKYNHAAQFTIRTGVAGRQVPIGALVTNFPATGPMDHMDVTTFLHEFGHLIHCMYSGHTRYASQSMDKLQWDFIEAPSQLLEEWVWDYDTLKTFASNDKGEPIPEALVKKMNASRKFGEAGMWQRQILYAAVSMDFYNRTPDFDLESAYLQEVTDYSKYPPLDGAHPWAGFGHLNGYSAIYYTYVWSKAIALDLFTRFKADGMRNPKTAVRYRKLVLEPAGSQDANVLIESFLGRPLSLDAFKNALAKES